MEAVAKPSPEQQLYGVLKDLFDQDPRHAANVSMDAICLISSYLADLGASERGEGVVEGILARLEDVQQELADLKSDLVEFRALRKTAYNH